MRLESVFMEMKKTKIICTISDIRCDEDFIRELHENGMNVVRINSAHATLEGAQRIVDNVRKVSDKIAILVDTKGPEVRLTAMESSVGFVVRSGDEKVEVSEGVTEVPVAGSDDTIDHKLINSTVKSTPQIETNMDVVQTNNEQPSDQTAESIDNLKQEVSKLKEDIMLDIKSQVEQLQNSSDIRKVDASKTVVFDLCTVNHGAVFKYITFFVCKDIFLC
jgi:hypothetical protein